MAPPFDRRRAEDVYRAIEDDVFPRIVNLELDVKKLTVDGCAHRHGDLLRTQNVEVTTLRIFERIEVFGKDLAAHQIDMTNQLGEVRLNVESKVGGIKAWVLTGVVIILLSVAGFFLQKHYEAVYDRPVAVQGR